ncbi:putative T7SS-secreted protein [Haloechinothrix sp. LS1_15]|uniref:putative T7SS-secreted protein n=1 Tax=Haloechinothrix sp. LS1_15 TaxID=2652248 RepID=UPI0029487990|nr:hypothetical protein [Haloechinothrix sp. LS1_15]MDV6014729.1 hypothetical protein [Haloechinothrix sp. LS1_15]
MSSLPRGAELGSTTDPKELIRGDAATVEDIARQLRERSSRLEGIADRLGSVQIDGWLGKASNAFWDSLNDEKPQWYRAADTITDTAEALVRHAEAILAAQSQAAEAIELWERGEAATREARERYDSAVAEANRRAQAGEQLGPMEPFHDPGERLREEAREVLRRAREQLEDSGSGCAGTIGRNCEADSTSPSWLTNAADMVSSAIERSGIGELKISQTLAEFGLGSGPLPGGGGPKWNLELGSWETGVSVWGDSVARETTVGDIDLAGTAAADVLGAGADSRLSIGSDGLKGELNADAYLLKAEADGSAEWGYLGAGLQGEAFVGAEAGLEGSVNTSGVKLGGEAFAGGRAEGGVHGDVGGVGAGLTGEVWAGAGAAADLNVGMDDGKFTVGAEAGAALGYGGKLGGEIVIDPEKVTDTANDVADAVGNLDRSTVDTVGDAARSTWDRLTSW